MKKAIIRSKTITAGLIILFMMGFTQIALPANKNENPVEFKYVYKLNNGPLFQLNLNNPDAGEFLIKVKDANGNLLYSEKLKGKNVSRKYQIEVDSDELYDAFNVRFEITSVKTHETLVYNVTNNTRVMDIIVAKL